MNETKSRKGTIRFRIRFGLIFAGLGLLIFLLGVKPSLFGLDRSPVVGFVQVSVFLVGLAMICVGGFTALNVLWNGREKTIIADIGFRLVSTGYVISAASGMADIFGFGNQSFPATPYFGPLQALGVAIGEIIIVVGLVMFIPFPRRKSRSLMDV